MTHDEAKELFLAVADAAASERLEYYEITMEVRKNSYSFIFTSWRYDEMGRRYTSSNPLGRSPRDAQAGVQQVARQLEIYMKRGAKD